MNDKFSRLVIENAELKSSETILNWGKTIIFAPHPDDESLGCGGAIALLRKYDLPVSVVTMTDGTLSHPNSIKYPPEKLRALREREMIAALEILGVAEDKNIFLRYRDRSVPDKTTIDFSAAVEKIKNILAAEKPRTILAPWRFDPHPDHLATWQIVSRAMILLDSSIRLIEYPVWLWELGGERDVSAEIEIALWRLDIKGVVETKQRAIHAHASQTTDLIDDDPAGFRLSPEVLAHFALDYETYLEEIK